MFTSLSDTKMNNKLRYSMFPHLLPSLCKHFSQPQIWNLMRTWLITTITLHTLCGCASLPDESYKLYPGPEKSVEELAVIRLGNAYIVRIDNMSASRSDWAEVHVLPGHHTIAWESNFMVSVMVNSSGWDKRAISMSVDLEAGHIYELKSDRTTGYGYKMYQWLEDLTSGEVVSGKKIP
jgi:hypothetical protein